MLACPEVKIWVCPEFRPLFRWRGILVDADETQAEVEALAAHMHAQAVDLSRL